MDIINRLVEDVRHYLPDATKEEVQKILKAHSTIHELIANEIEHERK